MEKGTLRNLVNHSCTWYNFDTPIGFELNETQYFYLTNLSGDVVGITDADGNLIARYSYDEWGKLLNIETAEENNAEQLAIAETNPLRYRGYYYDNETGMYYLQSRYYNPELCRFISADGFEYADTLGELNANLYMYCWNNAVAFKDAEGTTPKLAISFEDIVVYFVNLGRKLKDKVDESANKTKNKISKLVSKWDKSIKTHYNAFIDKLEYAINYPDVVINNILSKFGVKDFKVRFRLLEYIRKKANIDIGISIELPVLYKYTPNIAENEKTGDVFEVVLKVLSLSIQVDAITRFFEAVVQAIIPSFDLNKWFDNLPEKSQDAFTQFSLFMAMVSTKVFNKLKEFFDFSELENAIKENAYSKIVEKLFTLAFDSGENIFKIWGNFADAFNGYMEGEYYGSQGFFIFALNISMMAVAIFTGASNPVAGICTIIANIIMKAKIDFDNGRFGGNGKS